MHKLRFLLEIDQKYSPNKQVCSISIKTIKELEPKNLRSLLHQDKRSKCLYKAVKESCFISDTTITEVWFLFVGQGPLIDGEPTREGKKGTFVWAAAHDGHPCDRPTDAAQPAVARALPPLSTALSWSLLSSPPTKHPKQTPTRDSSLWKRFLCSGKKLIKKERTNYSPLGSAWPGCSQNEPVSRLQQVSLSKLKGSPRKRSLFFFLRHFNGKVKNKWNESKPFGCCCFSWCLL